MIQGSGGERNLPGETTSDVLGSFAADGLLQSRSTHEVLERVEDVARILVRAVEPLGDGFARVPIDVLERLCNALGPGPA